MQIICTAKIADTDERELLCDYLETLGGKPTITGDVVCLEYAGPMVNAREFIGVFEQYDTHGICIV